MKAPKRPFSSLDFCCKHQCSTPCWWWWWWNVTNCLLSSVFSRPQLARRFPIVPVDSSAAKIPVVTFSKILIFAHNKFLCRSSSRFLVGSCNLFWSCNNICGGWETFAGGDNCLGDAGKLLLELLGGEVEIGCHRSLGWSSGNFIICQPSEKS